MIRRDEVDVSQQLIVREEGVGLHQVGRHDTLKPWRIDVSELLSMALIVRGDSKAVFEQVAKAFGLEGTKGLLKRDVDSNRQLYEGLLEKLKEAGVTASLKSTNFRILDPARPPGAPVEPNIPRNLAFALVLGITSGIGLA